MAYNRRNHLMRVLEVQRLVIEYQGQGRGARWICKNIIYPKYTMSMATYYNYLNTNARKQLKELDLEESKSK